MTTPTVRLQAAIAAAARLIVAGWGFHDVAAHLRVSRSTVCWWKRQYPEFWQSKLAAARAAEEPLPSPPQHKTRRPRPQSLSNETRRKVMAAARLSGSGHAMPVVAAQLGVRPATPWEWRRAYPEVWKLAFDKAAVELAQAVREVAGTDAMLADLPDYIRRADAAHRWCEAQGVPLFARGETMTLTRFYREYYLPTRLCDASPRTRDNFDVVLRRWAAITGDPPLTAITSLVLAKFRDACLQLGGRSPGSPRQPETVKNYLVLVQALLDKAAQPGPRNRDAAGILERAPYVKPPKVTRKIPRTVSPEVLGNAYLATVGMDRPQVPGIKPPAWWRAILVVAYNTGLRMGSLWKLRMEWVDWQGACIRIPGSALKNRIGQTIPLNATTLEHLRAIRGERELVFPWTMHRRSFWILLRKLQALAAIPTAAQFTMHDLRRTLATTLWGVSPQAAQAALGHQTLEITKNHYAQTSGIVAQAIQRLPQPAAFATFAKGGAT